MTITALSEISPERRQEISRRSPGSGDYFSPFRCSDGITITHFHAPDTQVCAACLGQEPCLGYRNTHTSGRTS